MKAKARWAAAGVFVGLSILFAFLTFTAFTGLYVHAELSEPKGTPEYVQLQILFWGGLIGFVATARNVFRTIRRQ